MKSVIGCPDCAAIIELPPIRSGSLKCWQCHCTLERATRRPRGLALACALTTLILLFPANLMILLGISKDGFHAHTYLASGIGTIWREHWPMVAIVVTLLAVVLPFLRFGLLVASLGAVLAGHRRAWVGPAFRWSESLDLWAMPDVFLIGVAIGYSRLAAALPVTIGAGGWCLLAAAFMAMITRGTIERRRVWRDIMQSEPPSGPVLACLGCEMVLPAACEDERCPRCRLRLRRRRPSAMVNALALTITGLLLYPVANLFPVSVLDWVGGTSPHTLFSSVYKLVAANLYFLGACVFTTSIAIPFVKLACMIWFYVSVRHRSRRHLVFKTRAFRVIDELGRWSTMDIFTVVVYMPLVQFGQLATVRVGDGLPALLAVVMLTMFASRAFDPRLLWDAAQQR